MSREGKISMLQALLARVQQRAAAPRLTRGSGDASRTARAPSPADSEEQVSLAEGSSSLAVASGAEPAMGPSPFAEPVQQPFAMADDDDEQVPPSAPRVRDLVSALHEEPEQANGRGGALSGAAAQDEELEAEEMDIAITISDSPPPPPGETPPVEIPPIRPLTGFGDEAAQASSFDEFERPTAAAETIEALPETPDLSVSRRGQQELSWPPPVPAEPLAAEVPPPTVPRTPSPADAPEGEELAAAARGAPLEPPLLGIRLLVEPEPGAAAVPIDVPPSLAGHADAPITISAGSQVAPVLRGAAFAFVEQNRIFSPQSFGELLEASLELGRRA
jgi:hypothetical protein